MGLSDGGDGVIKVPDYKASSLGVVAQCEAELHSPLSERPATSVWIDALTADVSGAACFELGPTQPEALPGSVLHPAECGRREH